MSTLVGQNLGQYTVVEEIAKGGMGTVYRAKQTTIARDVAIKILPGNLTQDATFLERFNREVEIIAHLQHPHILPVYDFGEYEGLPYIVMAYLSGGTLADVIQRGPMELSAASRVVTQIASALDFAHQKGIIHRDFKPGNVLLDEQGNTYLADFGLAKITESSSQITGMMILGTPAYMAPEQSSPGELTPAVDIYALGVTVFQMLTGRVPFDAPTPLAVLMAHINQPIPAIAEFRADLPPGLQAVFAKAMAKDSEARYATAGDLAAALNRLGDGGTTDESRETSELVSSALLMTNMLGQMIFIDQQGLRLLKRHHHEVRNIIGKPLHEVLGFNRSVTDQLMKDIGKTGNVNDLELEILDSRGKMLTVHCNATATRDDKGAFVGADIALTPQAASSSQSVAIDFDTVDKRLDTMQETYLQTYFRAQLEALRDLLVQLGGKRLSKNLEAIINETAQRNVWPVSMQDGQLQVELRTTDADIYQALLAKAIAYAVQVTGKRPVAKQMQAVDNRLDANVLSFVKELGLTTLFKDLL